MLQIEALHKSYGRRAALKGVDLVIEPGEVCGLLGQNGAGKTTLVSVVAGLLRPDSGSVRASGIDVVARPDAARQHIGYAPQELGIYPLGSVRENLELFGKLAGLRRAALAQRITEIASALGLDALLDRQAGLTSGGEQRRLHTAIALLHRPSLVLLDEPTVAADVQSRAAVLDFVRGLADEGSAVCYSTHYLSEISELRATLALLHHGSMIARGPLDEIVAAHGVSLVELRFHGPAPALRLAGEATARQMDVTSGPDGDIVRIETHDPTGVTAEVLRTLGGSSSQLRGVEFVRPSLDSVFLALTGARYEEQSDVAVA